MAVKVSVGPPHLSISCGPAVLVTEPSGEVRSPTQRGLYFLDTRVLSVWRIYANNVEWDLLNSGSIASFASRSFFINRSIPTDEGEISPRTVSLALGRRLGHGLHEDLDVTNHGRRRVRFRLEVLLRSDFADIFEVKSGHIVQRGRIASRWLHDPPRLETTYRHADFCRSITVTPARHEGVVSYANGRISFELDIAPKGSWHACLLHELGDGSHAEPAPPHCIGEHAPLWDGDDAQTWRLSSLKLSASNTAFASLFDQAVRDMNALRLPTGATGTNFIPAGGVPWFMTLFGRDSLIAALQNILVHPDLASSTLERLAELQATKRDDFRDAEPGKIPHEIRHGELAHFHLVPHTPYYGTADATPLYLILLHAAWRATGDLGLVRRCLHAAERCLEWIDNFGDRDGDGFQEYQTRSSEGYENQGWKDAGDAILYPDGSPVKGPKAVCELQGYVYAAWLGMAEIYEVLQRPERAGVLRRKARQLFEAFNDVFWDEAEGCYALALDGDKRPVFTVASNPGHCLWCGIVPRDRSGRLVNRLLQPDRWSGWGIRTLSAEHPAYNPYSYQNGSIWPHDNGIIAVGFRRYGFCDEALRVVEGIFKASQFFVMQQMPELYAGIEASENGFPLQYLGANVPQAWAAGSAFFLLQCIVGAVCDAPGGKLYIDAMLPEWLPDLVLSDLRVGHRVFDLGFKRQGRVTTITVLKGDPASVMKRSFEATRPQA